MTRQSPVRVSQNLIWPSIDPVKIRCPSPTDAKNRYGTKVRVPSNCTIEDCRGNIRRVSYKMSKGANRFKAVKPKNAANKPAGTSPNKELRLRQKPTVQ